MKIKNAILISILCLNINLLSGQGVVKRQTYSINLEAYVGTWEFTSGSDIFRITLKKGSKDIDTSFGSCLIGDYSYSKNNVILDNYLISEIPTIYNEITYKSIIIFADNGKLISVNSANPNELYMYFYDKQRKKRVYSGRIQLISPTQIRWILEDDEGDYDADDWVEPGFSVPTNIIMTKK